MRQDLHCFRNWFVQNVLHHFPKQLLLHLILSTRECSITIFCGSYSSKWGIRQTLAGALLRQLARARRLSLGQLAQNSTRRYFLHIPHFLISPSAMSACRQGHSKSALSIFSKVKRSDLFNIHFAVKNLKRDFAADFKFVYLAVF